MQLYVQDVHVKSILRFRFIFFKLINRSSHICHHSIANEMAKHVYQSAGCFMTAAPSVASGANSPCGRLSVRAPPRRQKRGLQVSDSPLDHVRSKAPDLLPDGVLQLFGRLWASNIGIILEEIPQKKIKELRYGERGAHSNVCGDQSPSPQ